MHREPSPLDARHCGARRAGLLLGVLAVVVGLVSGPVAAQDAPDDIDPPKTEAEQQAAAEALEHTLALAPPAEDVPPSPDDPFQAVVDANDEVTVLGMARLDATAKSDAANIEALEAADTLKQAKDDEDAAIKIRDAAETELEDERERLSDLTVRAYVTGGDTEVEQYRAFVEGDTTDPAAGREIMFSQVLDRQKEVTEQAHDDLDSATSALADIRVVVAAAEAEALRLLAIASDLSGQRADAEQAHMEAVAKAEAADRALRSAANNPIQPVSVDVPLIGLPRLTPADLAGWFEQSPYRPRVATPIEDYARWFIEEGRNEGIRGDIAFAQAVLETGGFANTDSVVGNNFSGIGHYDNVPLGFQFATPRIGVRAQIQLLKSYAVDEPEYANPLVDPRLHGPSGCCVTWGDLTTVWATDPTYGPKVMLLYTSLVDYALKRRARGEGFDDPIPGVAPAVPTTTN